MAEKTTHAMTPDSFTSALAAFEYDCRQACRGLKVYIAVHVFGVGTVLPNNLAYRDEDSQ